MHPINKNNFGDGAGKLAVKFYDGSAVVSGYIVKQVGTKKFKVSKNDNSLQKICTLAQTTSEMTALTAGTGADSGKRLTLCTIEVTPFGGGVENVKSISTFKVATVQGTVTKHKLGASAAAGTAVSTTVAQIAIVATNAPNQTGTVAGAFSYVLPGNTFAGGNLPLTLSMSASPVFTFNASTGTISKVAGAGAAQIYSLTITAKDADGTNSTATVQVTLS